MPTVALSRPRLPPWRAAPLLRLLPRGLVLLAAGLLALNAYRWYQRLSAPAVPPVPSIPVTETVTSDPLQTLVASNLFGSVEGGGMDTPAQPPLSSLKLIVNGVVAAAERGLALISIEGKPQEAFAVGEDILPGVQLAEVQADRIFVKRGSLLEKLMLDGANETPLLSLMEGNSLPDRGSKRDRAEMAVSRETLRSKVQSPQELLSQVTLVKDGKAGFQLREIESGSLVEELGLQGGDTIIGVNGLAINSTDDMMRVYQAVKNADLVRLEIIREGSKRTLQYKIN